MRADCDSDDDDAFDNTFDGGNLVDDASDEVDVDVDDDDDDDGATTLAGNGGAGLDGSGGGTAIKTIGYYFNIFLFGDSRVYPMLRSMSMWRHS